MKNFVQFLKSSPTPFHAVRSLMTELKGFTQLREADSWKLSPGGKYYVVRGDSSIIAFRLGAKPVEETGVRLVGAHTDSPCLHVRPNAELRDRHYLRVGVEVYGGVLLSTWFDRDLSLAGRVHYQVGKGSRSTLIDFEKPIAFVPNLAIHLNRSANENRSINKQTEMPPLVALSASCEDFDAALINELRRAGANDAQSILGFDLCFYDVQSPGIVGIAGEFLAAARLDNLLSCYAGCRALVDANPEVTAVLVCNDHEEVGSASATGAQGNFLKSVLERLAPSPESYARAVAQSILVSADNAHGIHPAYPEKHESHHAPVLNSGPVLKVNTNQRYATNSETQAWMAACAQEAGVQLQKFVARGDMGCGSTIGPITASVTGIKTVDVGVPTFAMHSIRELAGTRDIEDFYRLLKQFYQS